MIRRLLLIVAVGLFCSTGYAGTQKTRVLLDTDANNELDDQHAIAYALFSGNDFDVEGITVNRTRNGGAIEQHVKEAQRIVSLCNLEGEVRVYKGADKSFDEIKDHITEPTFDGVDAVDFIIERANTKSDRKLVLLPVGKLTNVALALHKNPSIATKVRIVWLGSHYPAPCEYNLENDIGALNYILATDVPFEMAVVRSGKPSGTAAVQASRAEIRQRMPGLGPHISTPVAGRHGNTFNNFGDYSNELFNHSHHELRSLFDMAAVAIVKNPDWAESPSMPCPLMVDGKWVERPENPRKIILWENFDKDAIMQDFYATMEAPVLTGTE